MKVTIGLVAAAACLAGFCGFAWADAPDRSPRPSQRPVIAAPLLDSAAGPVAGAGEGRIAAPQAPKTRPAAPEAAASRAASPGAIMPSAQTAVAAVAQVKPKPRPLSFARRVDRASAGSVKAFDAAAAIQPAALSRSNTPGKDLVVANAKGSVCGDPAIKGEVLAPIGARVNGCGIANPVRVTSVSGIRLSQAATVDCATAKALKRWVDKGVIPAYGKQKVVQLQIAGSYMCRTRNHKKGAKISEHGRGRALDISGFTFANGKTVSVLRNYDATMRKAYRAACGVFGTTLGPGSDGMHEDHLHLDVARHRNGSYCR